MRAVAAPPRRSGEARGKGAKLNLAKFSDTNHGGLKWSRFWGNSAEVGRKFDVFRHKVLRPTSGRGFPRRRARPSQCLAIRGGAQDLDAHRGDRPDRGGVRDRLWTYGPAAYRNLWRGRPHEHRAACVPGLDRG